MEGFILESLIFPSFCPSKASIYLLKPSLICMGRQFTRTCWGRLGRSRPGNVASPFGTKKGGPKSRIALLTGQQSQESSFR